VVGHIGDNATAVMPMRPSQLLWDGREGQHRLRRRLEQQIVVQRLVVEGNVDDLGLTNWC